MPVLNILKGREDLGTRGGNWADTTKYWNLYGTNSYRIRGTRVCLLDCEQAPFFVFRASGKSTSYAPARVNPIIYNNEMLDWPHPTESTIKNYKKEEELGRPPKQLVTIETLLMR